MQTPLTKPLIPPTLQAFSHCGLEGVEVLVGLGLTVRQARVYLALLKVGDAKAKVVAEFAQVERQEVYGLIEDLKLAGLVEQNLTVPISYTATSIAEAVKMLLEQKTDQLFVLTEKAKRLVYELGQPQNPAATDLIQPCFGVICDGSRGRKYLKAIQEAQQSIDMATSWTRFKQQSFHFEDKYQAALKNGVTLRFFIEKPLNHRLPKWVKTTQEKHSNFKIKTQPKPLDASVTIFDQKKAAITFTVEASLGKGPDLWTENQSLTALCKAYFDTVWKQAKNY